MKGFGLIELLIVLLIVSVLSWRLLRTHQRQSGAVAGVVEELLRKDIEQSGKAELMSLGSSSLEGRNPAGSFRYSVEGTPPNRRVVREPPVSGLNDVLLAGLVFTAYDASGRALPDAPSSAELASMQRIRVEVRVHESKENPELYLNDGYHGVDLDGDAGNGVAKVRERSFGLIPAR